MTDPVKEPLLCSAKDTGIVTLPRVSSLLPERPDTDVTTSPEHRLLITINILPLLFIDFEQKLQNQYFHTNLFFFEILIDLIFFDFLIDFEIMNLLIF